LYCPDTERSTAGIHFVRMLREMGIHSRVAPRIRNYPNGAQAMAAMAAAGPEGERAIGCTQVTEILYTPGVTLIGLLPPPFELTTVYTAAVSLHSRHADRARQFAARLTGGDSEALRVASGFAQR
jgi:molybdate transport system substrate-binding protein